MEGTYESGNPNKYLPLDANTQPPTSGSQLALQSRARREPRLEGHTSRRKITTVTSLWTLDFFSLYLPPGSPTKLRNFMAAKCLWHERLGQRESGTERSPTIPLLLLELLSGSGEKRKRTGL